MEVGTRPEATGKPDAEVTWEGKALGMKAGLGNRRRVVLNEEAARAPADTGPACGQPDGQHQRRGQEVTLGVWKTQSSWWWRGSPTGHSG